MNLKRHVAMKYLGALPHISPSLNINNEKAKAPFFKNIIEIGPYKHKNDVS